MGCRGGRSSLGTCSKEGVSNGILMALYVVPAAAQLACCIPMSMGHRMRLTMLPRVCGRTPRMTRRPSSACAACSSSPSRPDSRVGITDSTALPPPLLNRMLKAEAAACGGHVSVSVMLIMHPVRKVDQA